MNYWLDTSTFVKVSASEEHETALSVAEIKRSDTAAMASYAWCTKAWHVGEGNLGKHFAEQFCGWGPAATEHDGNVMVCHSGVLGDEAGGLLCEFKCSHAESVLAPHLRYVPTH
jgi:hypothetical protein